MTGTRLLTAVVVSHNAGDALAGCIESLHAAGITEIVVVDNASSDGSFARLVDRDASVTALPTGKNLGYGAAANRGVAASSAEFVLICNPDLVVEPMAPALLRAALVERGSAAIAGPQIIEPDGTTYPSGRAFPPLTDAIGHAFVGMFVPGNRWSKRYRGEPSQIGRERAVDWVSGACMLVRKSAFSAVGGFDEQYFMYVEDLDLCWRLRRAAWRTYYVPDARVIHARGASSREHPYRLLVAHHASTWRFVRRSTSGPQRLLLPVIGVGIVVRLGLALGRTYQAENRAKRDRPASAVG